MPGTGSFFISERRTYDAYPFSLHSSRFRPRAAPVGAGAAAGRVRDTADRHVGAGRSALLASRLVRLHVIAVSDDDTEQAVKLQVRDAVLAYLEPQLADVTDMDTARLRIADDLDGIARAAQTAAGERPVRVSLGAEHYPTRDYGTFALPAGVYTSLRVTLGAGAGHNWWCVIFPPLCAQAAGLSERAVQALSDDDVRLVTESGGGYVVRFRLLELWDALVQRLS